MKQYLTLMQDILDHGTKRGDRTGTGTIALFGQQMRFDLSEGFPLVTTKRVPLRLVAVELLWFMQGRTDKQWLTDRKCHIWDEWMGPYVVGNLDLIPVKTVAPASYDGDFKGNRAGLNQCDAKLASIWHHMMRRCYDQTHHRFGQYGALGITVHQRWHNLGVFIEDVKAIPNWEHKASRWNDFELDKDYFGSLQYGPETSVWLPSHENILYSKTTQPVVVRDVSGREQVFLSISDVAREIGMSTSSAHRLLRLGEPSISKGNNRNFMGWEIDEYEVPQGFVLRRRLSPPNIGPGYGWQWRNFGAEYNPAHTAGWQRGTHGVDQLANIMDALRSSPEGRRHIVSAWNPMEVDDMALPPCHTMFQFYVAEGRLSCHLYQRSADMLLGVPFNIASYALLTHIIAREVGLDVGELVWTGGDCHIYLNHLTQVNEQLGRTPKALPQLVIEDAPRSPGDILPNYTESHFRVEGYDPDPAIKAPVAV